MWISRAKEHGKPDYTEERHSHVAIAYKRSDSSSKESRNMQRTSHASSVGNETDSDGRYSCHCIWWDAKKLRVRRFITQSFDDGRDEQGESIKSAIASHIDDHTSVSLPIFERSPDVVQFEVFMLGASLVVKF